MFELKTIEAATNKFADDQKIGQGGFGSVYKVTSELNAAFLVEQIFYFIYQKFYTRVGKTSLQILKFFFFKKKRKVKCSLKIQ